MGMHIAMVAARMPVADLRSLMLRTWPEFEIVESSDDLPSIDAMQDTMSRHERIAATAGPHADPRRSVYALWQDGPWAIVCDPTYVLSSVNSDLQKMSTHAGTVLSLIVETVAGCAYFACFENGSERRTIDYDEGELRTTGEPLPQEVGIDVSQFYMEESEALWTAFGLSTFEVQPRSYAFQVISVINHSIKEIPVRLPPPPPPEKPWWKFW